MPNQKSDFLVDEDLDTRPIGPGSKPEQGENPPPMLEGASEYEYVEIYNPLSVNFVGQFGVTRPNNQAPVRISSSPDAPGISRSEEDVRRNYGLDLRNPDHRGITNIINKVEIPSGQTRTVLGNEAQVIVNQLVTAILQKQGKQLLLADPSARHEIEAMVIRSRGFVQDRLGAQRPVTIQEQLHNEVKKIDEVQNEQAFPDQSNGQADEPAKENSERPSNIDAGQAAVDRDTEPVGAGNSEKPTDLDGFDDFKEASGSSTATQKGNTAVKSRPAKNK